MKKLTAVLIAVALVAIVAPFAVAENDTCVNVTVMQIPNSYVERGMSCVQNIDVEYPEDYYQYNKIINSAFAYLGDIEDFRGKLAGEYPQVATMYELRMQTILLERQNKLLAEQNELMRKQQKMSLVCNEMSSYSGCYSYVWREL